MYVLDTTTVSALMRSEPIAAARLLALGPADVLIPQPVLAEVRYGLSRLPSPSRRRTLEGRLGTLLSSVARAAWTDDVSARFGEAKAALEARGERVDDVDVAIAAHALSLGATLVTDNLRHFVRIPRLRVESWR